MPVVGVAPINRAVGRLIRHHIEYGQSGQRVQMKTLPVYGKQVIAVPLEMRVDSKHRNVGFLALSGRSKVGHRYHRKDTAAHQSIGRNPL